VRAQFGRAMGSKVAGKENQMRRTVRSRCGRGCTGRGAGGSMTATGSRIVAAKDAAGRGAATTPDGKYRIVSAVPAVICRQGAGTCFPPESPGWPGVTGQHACEGEPATCARQIAGQTAASNKNRLSSVRLAAFVVKTRRIITDSTLARHQTVAKRRAYSGTYCRR
jgi:hypothetical protein